MLNSPLWNAIESLRSRTWALRPLSVRERRALASRANIFDDTVELWAGGDFNPDCIAGNRFEGRVVLAGRIYHSTLSDVEVAPGALIDRCSWIHKTLIGPRAIVRNSTLECTKPTSFGVGTTIKAGLETPGRELKMADSFTLDTAREAVGHRGHQEEVEKLVRKLQFDRSVVGAGASLVNSAGLDRFFLGEGAVLNGVLKFCDSAAVCTLDEPVILGPGVQVSESILQWGVEIDSSALVHRSMLLEYSGAQRQALVSDSLVGPNTLIGEAEVHASFVGPFVGLHHHSLLIAAWWPEGRGNVGYGANLGSNHTSRAPDQEFRPGEGTFFGLAASVKFPANWDDAPYSILASGVVTLPQKISLPFSLITDEANEFPETRGLNRIIPGWVLSENSYALLRNEGKFIHRNKARRHQFDLRVFRPAIVEKLWIARELLGSISGKTVYTKEQLPEVGKNYLLETDRAAAVKIYERFLRYAVLKLFAESHWQLHAADEVWLEQQLARLGLGSLSLLELLSRYVDEEQQLVNEGIRSKVRDQRRGQSVIPDYEIVHGNPEDDIFLVERQKSVNVFREKLLENRANPS